jgi:hypothetical protein
LVTGIPGHPVKIIRFHNNTMEQAGGRDVQDIYSTIKDKANDYPSATMFEILPAYGFSLGMLQVSHSKG